MATTYLAEGNGFLAVFFRVSAVRKQAFFNIFLFCGIKWLYVRRCFVGVERISGWIAQCQRCYLTYHFLIRCTGGSYLKVLLRCFLDLC